jgi:DNA-binding transcriptional LysR family regulator
MELMQLEMFVAVVEESSVRRAAERVYRTQPAVSIALRKLEEEIGTPLLDGARRSNRNLTKAGELLYEYASRIIAMRNEAISLLRGENPRCAGRLYVGVDKAESLRWISPLGASFRQQHPNVRVSMHCNSRETLIARLQHRKLDVVLLSTEQDDERIGSDFVVTPISAFGRERRLWAIRRRAYQSYTLKVFGAMLLSFSAGSAIIVPERSRQLEERLSYVRRLRGEPAQFRPRLMMPKDGSLTRDAKIEV